MRNQVRIIGGRWRSRKVEFIAVPGLRPTPDRVRETLFNWLRDDVVGARCLDLFAGSGALGLEAASRGADYVVLVESDRQACEGLIRNGKLLQAAAVEIVGASVDAFLSGPSQVFDLVFLDPPFGRGLIAETCKALEAGRWLAPNAKIYVEAERQFGFGALPPDWLPLKDGAAGEVAYRLYQRNPEANP